MPLVLYNSLTRRKEEFRPIDPANVRMYVCGPTVYDLPHIGNARANVAFDLLYRVLRHEYGAEHVRYVRNITDVEDKIIAAAHANGEAIDALTARTTKVYRDDMAALGNLPPDKEPRATEYIPQMIALIERLIAGGHAYAAEGHALFSVQSWSGYGELSNASYNEVMAGARVEVAPFKREPVDFVLWKPSTPEQPGWDSPWGRGRPGWHIECSAMSETELGETFDIHGGGLDLIFPHHENEIAQSVCAHGGQQPQDFARVWMHNGMLTVGGSKMAKSEGNFITVRDALKQAPGEVIRLALLSTYYRDPLDWTEHKLEEAKTWADRFYRAIEDMPAGLRAVPTPEFCDVVEDDLNTPLAIRALQHLVSRINAASGDQRARWQAELLANARLLGLLGQGPSDWFHRGVDTSDVAAQIAERVLARKERRFADADRIREELAAEGIVLEDKPDGTTEWRRA